MFNEGSRYITKGIANNVPLELQFFMWKLIEDLKETVGEVDYLQVFDVSVIDEIENKVRIIHSQEIPEYKKIWIIKMNESCSNERIFVIDDETHSTMMLAEEY